MLGFSAISTSPLDTILPRDVTVSLSPISSVVVLGNLKTLPSVLLVRNTSTTTCRSLASSRSSVVTGISSSITFVGGVVPLRNIYGVLTLLNDGILKANSWATKPITGVKADSKLSSVTYSTSRVVPNISIKITTGVITITRLRSITGNTAVSSILPVKLVKASIILGNSTIVSTVNISEIRSEYVSSFTSNTSISKLMVTRTRSLSGVATTSGIGVIVGKSSINLVHAGLVVSSGNLILNSIVSLSGNYGSSNPVFASVSGVNADGYPSNVISWNIPRGIISKVDIQRRYSVYY